jgi:hypothetical protein
MKKCKSLIAVLFALMFVGTVGCASLLKLSTDVCDTVLSGSKAGALCEQIDKLKADEPEAE